MHYLHQVRRWAHVLGGCLKLVIVGRLSLMCIAPFSSRDSWTVLKVEK